MDFIQRTFDAVARNDSRYAYKYHLMSAFNSRHIECKLVGLHWVSPLEAEISSSTRAYDKTILVSFIPSAPNVEVKFHPPHARGHKQ